MGTHKQARFNAALRQVIKWANGRRQVLADRLEVSKSAVGKWIIEGEFPIRKAMIIEGWLSDTKYAVRWQDLAPHSADTIEAQIDLFKIGE